MTEPTKSPGRHLLEILRAKWIYYHGWIDILNRWEWDKLSNDDRNALERAASEFTEMVTSALSAKEGPLNSERWTLDELLSQLEQWKRVASGKTCVSFECLCYGASSLWHQTHRDNFRAIDRKPENLSRWVLEHAGSVRSDFPEQVLQILLELKKENHELKAALKTAIG